MIFDVVKGAGLSAVQKRLNPMAQARADVKAHLQASDKDKWSTFESNVAKSPAFIAALAKAKNVDPKLVQFATGLQALNNGTPVGSVESAKKSSNSYDIKRLPSGALGCTCADWKYRGTVADNYKCKHIKAFEEGKTKVSSFAQMTSAFLDELRKIHASAQAPVDRQRARSIYATADGALETNQSPGIYNAKPVQPIDEYEVIVGGGL